MYHFVSNTLNYLHVFSTDVLVAFSRFTGVFALMAILRIFHGEFTDALKIVLFTRKKKLFFLHVNITLASLVWNQMYYFRCKLAPCIFFLSIGATSSFIQCIVNNILFHFLCWVRKAKWPEKRTNQRKHK